MSDNLTTKTIRVAAAIIFNDDQQLLLVRKRNTTFFMQGNNLLNEKVYAHESFLPKLPQMGRNISIGMTTKF